MAHEASLHQSNCFVTLTYSDQYLPEDGSLSKRELQLFFKRARFAHGRFRYFAVGEYGERLLRPHYHLILFGFDFPDKSLWRRSPTGFYTYRSTALEKLWPFGHTEIGTVTPESAGYCARYCLKKVGGASAVDHYSRPHPVTGEVFQVVPEFALMSRRPGIGSDWYAKWHCDAFPSDFLVLDGQKVPVPRFYKKRLDASGDALMPLRILQDRKKHAREHAADNAPDRLAVRETLAELRADRLIRPLEQEQ